MTRAEKWRTLGRAVAVAILPGALIGFGFGLLLGGAGAAAAAGAVIGLLITAGMVTFNVSWAIGLIPAAGVSPHSSWCSSHGASCGSV